MEELQNVFNQVKEYCRPRYSTKEEAMTKQEIAASIRTRFGQNRGVINLTEFTQYMGVDRSTARRHYLNGLDYISTGRTKWYDIGEVAGRLMEMRDNRN